MNKKTTSSIALGILLIGLFSANVSQAQTYTNVYWNPTNGLGGTGNWGSSTVAWSTNSSVGGPTLYSPNTLGTNIVYNFSGPAGTVTNASSITVGGMNLLTTGYTFQGTFITYTGTDTNSTGTNAIIIGNNVNLNMAGTGFKLNGLEIKGGSGSTLTLIGTAGATNAINFGAGTANSGRTNSVNTIITGAGTVVLGSGGGNGFTQAGTIVNNSSATLVLTNISSGTVSLNGVVSGTGGLVLSNAITGKIALNGANTYAGGTTVNGTGTGYIALGTSTALGTGAVTITDGATSYLRTVANALDIANAINIGTGSTLQ
jgi:hypothetical protein